MFPPESGSAWFETLSSLSVFLIRSNKGIFIPNTGSCSVNSLMILKFILTNSLHSGTIVILIKQLFQSESNFPKLYIWDIKVVVLGL